MNFSLVSDSLYPPPRDRRYLLELLQVPEGLEGSPPEGTVWELPLDELFTLKLPTHRTTNGLEGYQFALTFTAVVPEPGTFALLAVGVTPFLLRSRRKQ